MEKSWNCVFEFLLADLGFSLTIIGVTVCFHIYSGLKV